MIVKELFIDILTKVWDLNDQVMLDAGIPTPFEDTYDIIRSKGKLLFRKKKPEFHPNPTHSVLNS